ncbi:MAG: V-type ATP synthase subunit D [Ruminococcaceae bacterium]|nr:V-type ATP synthase subunit D [Oscillospiraceae bacterium]
MNLGLVPTKGNLILSKNTLKLSEQGYDLLDKKRTILINEMMGLIGRAEDIQTQIDQTFADAYVALQRANISEGISRVKEISAAVPLADNLNIRFRSVMGVEIPEVAVKEEDNELIYGFMGTSNMLDEAVEKFRKVRALTEKLAEIETSVYRLAMNIKKTQKRANALKNIIIPRYTDIVRNMTNVLEEKEREEFSRLKVIKNQKNK